MAENNVTKVSEAEYIASNESGSVVIDVEQTSSSQAERMDSYAEVANKMLEEG